MVWLFVPVPAVDVVARLPLPPPPPLRGRVVGARPDPDPAIEVGTEDCTELDGSVDVELPSVTGEREPSFAVVSETSLEVAVSSPASREDSELHAAANSTGARRSGTSQRRLDLLMGCSLDSRELRPIRC